MAYKVFVNGFNLSGPEVNTYLMNQTVMVFANTAARLAALATPSEGMVTFLEDSNALQYYITGLGWVDVGSLAVPPSLSPLLLIGA
jgi:hypothetical protein